MSMLDQLPHITSRIETFTPTGVQSIGTGFFFSFEVPGKGVLATLITNKHVVNGANRARIYLSHAEGETAKFGKFDSCEITGFDEFLVGHPDPNVDLAAFPVGPFVNQMASTGTPAFFRALGSMNIPNDEAVESFTAIENILMIGYPTGMWDNTNNLPIVRRGITATPYARDYNGRPEFLIDCACFPGSSGSPILIADNGSYPMKNGGIALGTRLYLLGLLWGGPQYSTEGQIVAKPVPTSTVPVSVSQIPTNLGYCIKARMIRDLEPLLIARFSS
jgi:V8-like Glu-specific endopeptidase